MRFAVFIVKFFFPRAATAVLFFFFTSLVGFAQSVKSHFTLPRNASFIPGEVRVKVKPQFKSQFLSGSIPSAMLHAHSAAPLVKPALARKGAAWNGPRAARPSVDIALFHTLKFDTSRGLENYINELYATGMFEIVEPVYLQTPALVPNDARASEQYYLSTIRALDAWDISQGSEDITIAIVDTGGDLDHPDLAGKLYVNSGEIPGNQIDDDGDGYVDNYHGWDFVGADTLNILLPSFPGDGDPSVHSGGDIRHGTMAAGCAGAAVNNGIGIAGVGFRTKIMFTKHTADNQKIKPAFLYNTLEGILYAANQGARIINCSYGGSPPSQIEQDIINHVTNDLGCLIVAAAGNSANETLIYPAAYDNVLSVAATDADDKATFFTNYGFTVDIAAPGISILTTSYDDDYVSATGTSFSSPITAGAAALVWSYNPSFSPRQIAEQLRMSADADALYTANPAFTGKLGRGRLDVLKAITTTGVSVRANNPRIVNSSGGTVAAGEKGLLSFDFVNYLNPTTPAFTVSLSVASPYVTVSQSTINPGALPTLGFFRHPENPFELTLADDIPQNTRLELTLTYSDAVYSDTQVLILVLNPSWLDIGSNKILTSVSDIGRIGFQDPGNGEEGQGFVFKEEQLLFEMGVLMGTSASTIQSNIRGSLPNTFDQDFVSLQRITRTTPGLNSDSEVSGIFSNSDTPALQKIIVSYRSLVWKAPPLDQCIVLEYKIRNAGSEAWTDFYFGMFADWDISPSADVVHWRASEKLAFIQSANGSLKPMAGMQVLSENAHAYSIDNNQALAGNPFGIYDGFTAEEKFLSLSSDRTSAGGVNGGDISQVVSSGPWSFDPGETITIAFALHGGSGLPNLIKSAEAADSVYQQINPVTGIEKPQFTSEIYPVPTSGGSIRVHLPVGIHTAVVSVLTLQGQEILNAGTVQNSADDPSISIADLSDGFYWVHIKSNAGSVFRKLIILREQK